ncbi:hypothetical protein GGR51DRAFT_433224 [Nemania sp. FL0031]|nr:hypothetical protein GGR51DRAFT_433224 [Nemania sp. FL0031]
MASDSDSDYRESSSEQETSRPPMHTLPSVLPIRQHAPIPPKRRAETFTAPTSTGPPPLKRLKGDFNAGYLNLLNQDIHDASSGRTQSEDVPELEGLEGRRRRHTQIGAVEWSAAEKNAFFAAVRRLGRGDVARVAARIGTKSEVEVRQFLALLDATEARHTTLAGSGRGGGHSGDVGVGAGIGGEGKAAQQQRPLRPVDIPAAVEIGAECAAALEAAADALSLRQESYEGELEKERWGSRWLVTAPLARILENSFHDQQQQQQQQGKEEQRRGKEEHSGEGGQPSDEERGEKDRLPDELPFLQLFAVKNWLRLSDRIFMNSAVSDSNWHAVSEEDEPPAIRATALADFHALVHSVTRRLLFATIYVAESRIRTKSQNDSRRRPNFRIRVEDVDAAVSSLGMKHNSRQFWAGCARRLRLDVVDNRTEQDDFTDEEDEEADTDGSEDTDGESPQSTVGSRAEDVDDTGQETEENEEEDLEVMSYDQVEAALGFPIADNIRTRRSSPGAYMSTASEHISSASEEQEEYSEEDEANEEDIEMRDRDETRSESDDGLNLVTIKQEIEEALASTAVISTRQAVGSRIRAEHKLERDAELLDLKASTDAQAELWAVLRGDGDLRTKGRKNHTREE